MTTTGAIFVKKIRTEEGTRMTDEKRRTTEGLRLTTEEKGRMTDGLRQRIEDGTRATEQKSRRPGGGINSDVFEVDQKSNKC